MHLVLCDLIPSYEYEDTFIAMMTHSSPFCIQVNDATNVAGSPGELLSRRCVSLMKSALRPDMWPRAELKLQWFDKLLMTVVRRLLLSAWLSLDICEISPYSCCHDGIVLLFLILEIICVQRMIFTWTLHWILLRHFGFYWPILLFFDTKKM